MWADPVFFRREWSWVSGLCVLAVMIGHVMAIYRKDRWNVGYTLVAVRFRIALVRCFASAKTSTSHGKRVHCVTASITRRVIELMVVANAMSPGVPVRSLVRRSASGVIVWTTTRESSSMTWGVSRLGYRLTMHWEAASHISSLQYHHTQSNPPVPHKARAAFFFLKNLLILN